MDSDLVVLSAEERRRFAEIAKSCPVKCKHVQQNVASLADYFAAIGGIIGGADTFWFRGHPESNRSLTPAALRPKTIAGRQAALGLISDFKRIAEAKLPRLPDADDEFKWAQLPSTTGCPLASSTGLRALQLPCTLLAETKIPMELFCLPAPVPASYVPPNLQSTACLAPHASGCRARA